MGESLNAALHEGKLMGCLMAEIFGKALGGDEKMIDEVEGMMECELMGGGPSEEDEEITECDESSSSEPAEDLDAIEERSAELKSILSALYGEELQSTYYRDFYGDVYRGDYYGGIYSGDYYE